MLGLKSFTLFLTGAHPHFEFDVDLHLPINMYNIFGTFDIPVGLDGIHKKSMPSIWGANPGHITAAKGRWLNGRTFELETQDLGFGGASKYILSFTGKKLGFARTDP